MENLLLIEKHRKRISLLIALFLFLSLYLVIFVFLFTSAYYKDINEDKQLLVKTDRVVSVVKAYETLFSTENQVLKNIVDQVVEDAYVYSNSWVLIESEFMNFISPSEIPLNSVVKQDFWKKIYKTIVISDGINYTVFVSLDYQTLLERLWKTFLILLSLAPFVYLLLVFLMTKFVVQMYNPLKEMVLNLEGFATNINHEFKTSLTEIISSLELAQMTGEYEAANTYSVGSSRRLNSMLDTLGTIIHFVNSDYRKERINIYKVLDTSLTDFKTLIDTKSIRLNKNYDPQKYLYIYIDKSPLILSFQNILKNAIKYSHEGWTIDIEIYRHKFIITDYGVGIEKENLDKIYDRYFRESYSKSGSGIGLSIIKRITEIYNWDISIESEKDTFTRVTIQFSNIRKKS